MIAKSLVTTSLVVLTALAAAQARAADVNATSAIDAVTVYPDGASVTRVIALDLPAEAGHGRVTGTLVVHADPDHSVPPFVLQGGGGWISG